MALDGLMKYFEGCKRNLKGICTGCVKDLLQEVVGILYALLRLY